MRERGLIYCTFACRPACLPLHLPTVLMYGVHTWVAEAGEVKGVEGVGEGRMTHGRGCPVQEATRRSSLTRIEIL